MAEQKNSHEALHLEDALSSSERFFQKNKKTIVAVVVAIIAIIVCCILYFTLYAIPREKKAQVAIFKGQEYFQMHEFDKALNGDSISFVGFIKIADKFSGTKAANLANAYAGLCYAQLNKNEDAIKYLDKFSGNEKMIAPAILGAMGNCYASQGNLDKAVSYLMKAAKEADNSTLSPIFLKQAGDIYMQQKQYDKALEAYTTIKEKYFDSFQAASIDKYIELAKLKK